MASRLPLVSETALACLWQLELGSESRHQSQWASVCCPLVVSRLE